MVKQDQGEKVEQLAAMLEDERKAHEETSKARLQAFSEKESNILERQRKYVKEIEQTSQELKNALKTADSQ